MLSSAASRLVHAGTPFDVDLPLTGPRGIECRKSGANSNYSVVFTFTTNVSSCGTTPNANGTVVAGPNANQCTVNLTNAVNAQTVTVELDNVTDVFGANGNVSVLMGLLVGDTNADGFVDAVDTAQTKSQSGKPLSQSNFREDVNADGFIDAVDVSLVKSRSGSVLNSASPQSRSR